MTAAGRGAAEAAHGALLVSVLAVSRGTSMQACQFLNHLETQPLALHAKDRHLQSMLSPTQPKERPACRFAQPRLPTFPNLQLRSPASKVS